MKITNAYIRIAAIAVQQMTTFRLYDDLGVPKNATKEEIKKAYRKAAIANHPDKGGDAEVFKKISNAYQILSDDNRRQMYDQLGDDQYANGGGEAQDMNAVDPSILFQHIFSQFGGDFGFGGRQPGPPPPRRRNDHQHAIKVSMEEAYRGITKTVRISLQKTCLQPCCVETCFACQGKGTVTDLRRMGFMTQMMTRVCDPCKGSGMSVRGKPECTECKGEGKFQTEVVHELHIPPGVPSGHRITCVGYGEQPCSPTEIPGDLIFEIMVLADPNFQRQGNDLVHTIKMTFRESIVGKEVSIPHFKGPLILHTKDYGIIQTNKRYILKGMGMTSAGNLVIVFHIDYPDGKIFTDEERDVLEKAFDHVGV